MPTRDRAAEISEIKSRGQSPATSLYYDVRQLKDGWNHQLSSAASPTGTPDFFPIRAVTLLEVFTRAWIAQLIDHGSPYVDNAVALAKNLRLDYELVRAIQGRAITVGDLVAHTVPVNTFSQVIGYFEILISQPFIALVAKAVDRWETEVNGKPATPIIENGDNMCAVLSRLFDVRHILCHEYPRKRVYALEEVSSFLTAAEQFAKATTAAFNELLLGKYPLSNFDMKKAANEAYMESDAELERVISELKAKADEINKRLLDESQEPWLRFRKAQCAFRADLARGGTLAGLLWLREAKAVTEVRLKELRWYLEREEYDV